MTAQTIVYQDNSSSYAASHNRSNNSFFILSAMNSVLDGVSTASQKNIVAQRSLGSAFTQINLMAATASTWEAYDESIWDDFYVDLITTSAQANLGAFQINDCDIKLVSYDGTYYRYRVFCTSGTAEVRRAQVYKTLFYGTDGSDSAGSAVTNVTEAQVSKSTDVGKRGHFAHVRGESLVNLERFSYKGTFTSSSGTAVSLWSKCKTEGAGAGCTYASFSAPVSTGITQIPPPNELSVASETGGVTTVTKDEIGTDTSADNLNNPLDVGLNGYYEGGGSPPYNEVWFITVAKGEMTWVVEGDAGAAKVVSTAFTDYTDFIPVFTSADDLGDPYVVTPIEVISADDTTIIFKSQKTIDSSSTLQAQSSIDGGTSFTDIDEEELQRIRFAGDSGTRQAIKFKITKTDDTKRDKITSYVYYHG